GLNYPGSSKPKDRLAEEDMYRSILVPLDGSLAAEHALPLALSLARRFGAALQIVHVYVPIWGKYGRPELAHELIDREMRERRKAYNDAVIQRLSAVGDISLSAAYLEGPVVASTINRHAADSGADLMVMTTQGRAPMARFWLGSVADTLKSWGVQGVLLCCQAAP